MVKKVFLVMALIFGILGLGSQADASLVVFELDSLFSWSGIPGGPKPWLTATFDDHDASGNVTLTLLTSGLASNEYVSEWAFNVGPNPGSLPAGFNISLDGSDPGDTTATISWGYNFYQADGDGHFDIRFQFPTPNNASRFTQNESAVFNITGTGITANSFLNLSQPGGGAKSGLYTLAHIQGIGGDDSKSAWVTVPIPAAAWLLGSGLVGLIVIRRRMKK